MARIALAAPSARAAAMPTLSHALRAMIALLLFAGCASRRPAATIPAKLSTPGVATRLLIPPDLDVDSPETVVNPNPLGPALKDRDVRDDLSDERTTFALQDAIEYALQNNPRLRAARAAIERARGQEQVAFAPFLPQFDLLSEYGVVSRNLVPGTPGPVGLILPTDFGTRSYTEIELGLQWMLYDFGRTGGRYRQSVARERITELQLVRARQTVEFEVAFAYMDVLLARASRRVQDDAVRRAEAILEDTVARRGGGVALKEDVLRAEVQLSESREALVLAREAEFNSVSRLNNVMGRNAGLPLEVLDFNAEPLPPAALAPLLALAADQRPEVSLARQAVAAAEAGRQAAQGEFLPKIFVRGSAGRIDGENVATGWQEGAGLHLVSPLYAGGQYRGELRSAEADIQAALADTQIILDAISLQVNVAYRGVIASRERIDLARTAVVQAEENLRLLRVRYLNGDATPTDIVDSEAALTRSQQRFFSATYTYLAALARLDYAVGRRQGDFLQSAGDAQEVQPKPGLEELPAPIRLPTIQ
jgi:outer membrane protein TolC